MLQTLETCDGPYVDAPCATGGFEHPGPRANRLESRVRKVLDCRGPPNATFARPALPGFDRAELTQHLARHAAEHPLIDPPLDEIGLVLHASAEHQRDTLQLGQALGAILWEIGKGPGLSDL